ncbi:hypothetical protein [Neobacillus sp. LXY-4]
MSVNDKVLFSGEVFKVYFDYKNGQYEIMSENMPRKVLLVTENEISKM